MYVAKISLVHACSIFIGNLSQGKGHRRSSAYDKNCKVIETKYCINPTIFNIIRWVDGTNDSSTKHLMFQALFFFIISYRLRALKTLYFYFCKFINFCKEFWNIRCLVDESFVPATQRIILKIVGFDNSYLAIDEKTNLFQTSICQISRGNIVAYVRHCVHDALWKVNRNYMYLLTIQSIKVS